jgi:hypothetical protein
MSITLVRDCISVNLGASSWSGQMAGYVTGSGDVPWTQAQINAHPGLIRIDQTPTPTGWDKTADVDDYENGTVLLSELAPRAKERKASFAAATRPGQREPMVYAAASDITTVVNALIAGGVTSGVFLWVASWGVGQATAITAVQDAAGPFPIAGWQFADASMLPGPYDLSVFSSAWLAKVSRSGPPPPPPPPPGPGPYLHHTNGARTLTEVAAEWNTTFEAMFQRSVANWTAADWAVVTDLLGSLKLTGFPYYTLNP